jgi:type VI protein secretion system component Hcp
MAITIFMSISNPGIRGGSTVKGEANQFDVTSLSFSTLTPVSGRPTVSQVTVTMPSYNVPDLLNSAFGDHNSHTVTFSVMQTTVNTQAPTLLQRITLTNASMTLFQQTVAKGDTTPSAELSFVYRQIEIEEEDTHNNFTYSTVMG